MSLKISKDPQAHCTLARQFTYHLTWYPERNYPAGSSVELRAGSLRSFYSWRFTELKMNDGDITYRWKINPSVSEMRRNPTFTILRAGLQYGVLQGKGYTFRIRAIPPHWAGIDMRVNVWTIGPDNPRQEQGEKPPPEQETESSCVLTVKAGPVERVCLYSRPAVTDDKRVRMVVSPQDRWGNPGRFENAVNAEVSFGEEKHEMKLQESTVVFWQKQSTATRSTLTLNMSDLSFVENIMNGTIEGEKITVISNPVYSTTTEDMIPAFGEFHWHTSHSGDGQRPIREALRCAKDELNLDFAAPGDHNTQGEKWDDTVEALNEFNKPGDFATFFGWEASSKLGHENFYFTDPKHPLVCGGSAGFTGGFPLETREILQQYTDFLVVPHHTNAVAESRRVEDDAPFWHPYSWTIPTPAHRLVEIFQTRGNQERNEYPDAWRGWHQYNGASVQDALEKGYPLGFVGGTDNHCGWPGRAFERCEGLGIHPPYSQILTGVWTKGVDRQSVYDALYARHTWAVWDTRAVVWFSVNEAMMGDGLSLREGDEPSVHIRINAESPFQSVELVREGEIIWQKSFNTPDIDVRVQLPAVEKTMHVYLRALLRNGGIIYASPVFITV